MPVVFPMLIAAVTLFYVSYAVDVFASHAKNDRMIK
jgi:hypothetical protein